MTEKLLTQSNAKIILSTVLVLMRMFSSPFKVVVMSTSLTKNARNSWMGTSNGTRCNNYLKVIMLSSLVDSKKLVQLVQRCQKHSQWTRFHSKTGTESSRQRINGFPLSISFGGDLNLMSQCVMPELR